MGCKIKVIYLCAVDLNGQCSYSPFILTATMSLLLLYETQEPKKEEIPGVNRKLRNYELNSFIHLFIYMSRSPLQVPKLRT
jgi:hypothetical protein